MKCVECSRQIISPALVAAMEQSNHFALTRNCEACDTCARRSYEVLKRHQPHRTGFINTMECNYCGKGSPIMRLRYDITVGLNSRTHEQFALCEPCYGTVRDELLRASQELVGFLEKEWNTGMAKAGKRLPWPTSSRVMIKHHVGKFHDMTGRIVAFRGLVQPWFGYDIEFDAGGHHFFHERDLQLMENSDNEDSHHDPPLGAHRH